MYQRANLRLDPTGRNPPRLYHDHPYNPEHQVARGERNRGQVPLYQGEIRLIYDKRLFRLTIMCDIIAFDREMSDRNQVQIQPHKRRNSLQHPKLP